MNGDCIYSPLCSDVSTSSLLTNQVINGICGCMICVACLHRTIGTSPGCVTSTDLQNKCFVCPECEMGGSFPLGVIPSYLLVQELVVRSANLAKKASCILRKEAVPQQPRPSIPITTKKSELLFVACPVCLSYTLPVNQGKNRKKRFPFLIEVSVPSSTPTILVVDYTRDQCPKWKKTNAYSTMRRNVTHCASTFFVSPFMETMIPRFYQCPTSELCHDEIRFYYDEHPGAPEPSQVSKRKKNEPLYNYIMRVDEYWLDKGLDRRETNRLAWEHAHERYWNTRKREHLLRLISANYSMPIPTHYDDDTWKRIALYES